MALPNNGLDLEMIRVELGLSHPTTLEDCRVAAGFPHPCKMSDFYGYTPADITPPTTPTDLGYTSTSSGVKVYWSKPTGGPVGYNVYGWHPDNTMYPTEIITIDSGDTLTYYLPHGLSHFQVRAFDAAGNYSETSQPFYFYQ